MNAAAALLHFSKAPGRARKGWFVIAAAAFFVFSLVLPHTAHADALKEGAGKFIESLSKQAITELTDDGIDDREREARFRRLLNNNFDIPVIGKWVLGRYWRAATPEERRNTCVCSKT